MTGPARIVETIDRSDGTTTEIYRTVTVANLAAIRAWATHRVPAGAGRAAVGWTLGVAWWTICLVVGIAADLVIVAFRAAGLIASLVAPYGWRSYE